MEGTVIQVKSLPGQIVEANAKLLGRPDIVASFSPLSAQGRKALLICSIGSSGEAFVIPEAQSGREEEGMSEGDTTFIASTHFPPEPLDQFPSLIVNASTWFRVHR